MDCRDIINKLNEVGLECPTFVAISVAKLPLATLDAFNLAKISKDRRACYHIILCIIMTTKGLLVSDGQMCSH